MLSEIKELKEIETKLEKLEIKALKKRYKNEIKDAKMLIEQELELGTKKQKKKKRSRRFKNKINK